MDFDPRIGYMLFLKIEVLILTIYFYIPYALVFFCPRATAIMRARESPVRFAGLPKCLTSGLEGQAKTMFGRPADWRNTFQ